MRELFVLLLVILAFMTASVSCGPKGNEGREHGAAETQPASTVSSEAMMYVCPMHPDVQSDKPGECPKCGMSLKSAASDTHDHSTHKH